MSRYSVATDYEHNRTHKRDRITIWSGAFCSDYEGSGIALPGRDGYMLTLLDGRKLRVSCPCPRTEENYVEVDACVCQAIADAECLATA